MSIGNAKRQIILIDFENVQPRDLTNLQGRQFQIKVFCGANQTKVPLDLAEQLQRLGPDSEYIRIQGTGTNALDFHIAYYIGHISAQSPESIFYIISKDKGFEPLIKHLATARKVPCHLVPSLTCLPGAAPGMPQASDRIQKVADGLLTCKEGKPRKLRTLTAFVKAQLNVHATDVAVAQVIAHLTRAGMSTDAEGRLAWPSASPDSQNQPPPRSKQSPQRNNPAPLTSSERQSVFL